MMTALYSGATGMKAHDSGMSSISNNIANVNTIGFKQQYALFQDLFSQDLPAGAAAGQTMNQLGLGATMAANRTVFTEGAFEPGSEVTDLAITGKGYFQVSDGHDSFYTRAGNFRFDKEGWLRTPAGMSVTGMPMTNGTVSGAVAPIRIDPNDPTVSSSPAKATEAISASLLMPASLKNSANNAENPYFSMVRNWNGAVTNGEPYVPGSDYGPAMRDGSYANKQTLKVMDAEGKSREVTLYLDGTGQDTGAGVTYEYLLATDPSETIAEGGVPTRDSGMLMAGTITFGTNGSIADMTAFTPTGTDNPENRLEKWVPATLKDGKPQFTANFADTGQQTVAMDFGLSSATGQWAGMPANAAQVGTDRNLLGGMADATRAEKFSVTSATASGVSVADYKQDGFAEGHYSNMEVTADGIVRMNFTNSKSVDLYTIPLFRFTSDDGLRREGGNLYAATPDSGEVFQGVPGTNNFGSLQSSQLESSNVDMSREMVSLIVMQRGFQMNSKSITTADQLLQKAMELKRN